MRTAQQVDRSSLAKAGQWLAPGAEKAFRSRAEVDIGFGDVRFAGDWTSSTAGAWTVYLPDKTVTATIPVGSTAADVAEILQRAMTE